MKRLALLAVCFFSLLSAYAQRPEIGISGGIATTNAWYQDLKPVASPAGSLRVVSNGNNYQIGVILDAHLLRMRYEFTPLGQPEKQSIVYKFGAPLLSLGIFANYRHDIGQSYLYIGGRGGYAVSMVEENGYSIYKKGSGIFVGAQLGGVLAISKHFGLNAEFSPCLYFMGWDYKNTFNGKKNEQRSVFSLPITLGIRYWL